VRSTVVERETIQKTNLDKRPDPVVKQIPVYAPEPFERTKPVPTAPKTTESPIQTVPEPQKAVVRQTVPVMTEPSPVNVVSEPCPYIQHFSPTEDRAKEEPRPEPNVKTEALSSDIQLSFLSEEAKKEHRIIGQVFSTYWMVEYDDKLYIIDQHAAHERILYESIISARQLSEPNAQQLFPPIVISLNLREQELLNQALPYLEKLGYEIESFGGKEYKVSAIPADLPSIEKKDFLMEFIDSLLESGMPSEPDSIYEKIASISCKAAVKGNHKLSYEEASALIEQLMKLENPFHCPHGRPVTIELSKYELEKKFKRII